MNNGAPAITNPVNFGKTETGTAILIILINGIRASAEYSERSGLLNLIRDIKIRDTKAENTMRKLMRILPTATYNSEKTIKVKYIQ
jgi:hypothetical protein